MNVLEDIVEECGYTNHMLVFRLAHDVLFKQASIYVSVLG